MKFETSLRTFFDLPTYHRRSLPEQTKRQRLELYLASRAGEDPEFRERLIADPKRTIENELGLLFPTSVVVSVHEEKLNHLHVVLPIGLAGPRQRFLPEETPDFSTRKAAPLQRTEC